MDSAEVLARRRAVVDGADDHSRDNRASAESFAQAPAYPRVHSTSGEADTAAAEHSLHRSVAVHEPERGRATGLLQRRNLRSVYQWLAAWMRRLGSYVRR